jgi:hypothetical protein
MPAAVFEDFLAAASEHLEAAVTVREEDLARPPAALTRPLRYPDAGHWKRHTAVP